MVTVTDFAKTIGVASQDESERVVSAIVLAFSADPVTRWVWPDPHQYVTSAPEFVRAFGGAAFDTETAFHMADFSGAALWLPPGSSPDEAKMESLIGTTVGADKQPQLVEILEGMAHYHPTETHWYLPLLGVDPTRQGQGLGSALLKHTLDRIDADHLPAYLESSNPRNVSLYIRYGFELLGSISVPGAPPVLPMLRSAR